jgi:molybdate transport system permease protein
MSDEPISSRSRSLFGGRNIVILLSLPLVAFLVVPLVSLVLRTPLSDIAVHLRSEATRQAIRLSLVTATSATAITSLFGTPLAYLIARRQFKGRALLDSLIDLPMILPPAVAGLALLLAFGRRGIVGSYLDAVGITLPFTEVAVIMAQVFVAAPYYIKSAEAGFTRIDRDLEDAAAIDGASPRKVFRHITLPLSMASIVGGAFMTWARALGEFGATIIFAGNLPGRTQTMPLAIYIGFELNLDAALTLAALLLIVSFAILAVLRGVLHRNIYAGM